MTTFCSNKKENILFRNDEHQYNPAKNETIKKCDSAIFYPWENFMQTRKLGWNKIFFCIACTIEFGYVLNNLHMMFSTFFWHICAKSNICSVKKKLVTMNIENITETTQIRRISIPVLKSQFYVDLAGRSGSFWGLSCQKCDIYLCKNYQLTTNFR